MTRAVYKQLSVFTEDPPVGGTDVDIQLLEAAKAGDIEVIKVSCHGNQGQLGSPSNHRCSLL